MLTSVLLKRHQLEKKFARALVVEYTVYKFIINIEIEIIVAVSNVVLFMNIINTEFMINYSPFVNEWY